MRTEISRRQFVKSSLLASTVLPLAANAQESARPAPAAGGEIPSGKIGDQVFSRLMLGGNLIAGWAHARELSCVSQLMRHYNTDAKICETLELAERQGITTLNSWVMDNNQSLFDHWKRGGKLNWIAQVRFDGNGGFDQARRTIDEGASAVHLTGDNAEGMLYRNQFEKVGQMVQFIKGKKRLAGVGAHDLQVVVESEQQKFNPDFYVKTLHTHDYYTSPTTDDNGALGKHDNSWCSDPQAVVDVMAKVNKPWIAFKILAAGDISPRSAFPYALNNGADFILVGMFDWQIEENVALARRVLSVVAGPDSKRTRAWCA